MLIKICLEFLTVQLDHILKKINEGLGVLIIHIDHQILVY